MAQPTSLVEFLDTYPDDETAEKQFIEWRWPDGIACPKCGDTNIQENAPHRDMRFRCRGCMRFFSVRTGTLMQSSKLGYRTWLIAMQRMLSNPKGVSAKQLQKDLGIGYPSAWFLGHRIRESWSDENPVFSGIVEVDETFVGGIEKNKHALKKDRSGSRGWATKVIVAGFKERSSGRVFAKQLPGIDLDTISDFVHEHTAKDAIIYSDDHRGYDSIRRHRYHVKHSVGEYVAKGGIHTNGIENFWSTMKRARKGTYIKWSRRHAPRYVAECCGRMNMRGLGGVEKIGSVWRRMDGKRLTYRALVRSPVMLNNESHRPTPRTIWRRQRDMRTPTDRLTPKEVEAIKEMRRTRGSSYKAIALKFNVSASVVQSVVNGKYKHDAKPGRKRKK